MVNGMDSYVSLMEASYISHFGLNIFYSVSFIQYKQSTNNITKQLNERDLTVSVSLYKSSPERWYDV